MKRPLLFVGLSFVSSTLLAVDNNAHACGGFFCANTPVVQSGERIIFAVDPASGDSQIVINITYSGAAEDFAWVLPLPSEPSRIAVGSSWAFVVADRLTAPRFNVTFEQVGCNFNNGGGPDAGAFAALDGSVSDAGAGGVSVLQQEVVGPYDTVVISGNDPEAMRLWLVENGYRVTDEMMMSVTPYLATNHVLLALKLRKESAVGDLQPISLRLRSIEPCIPLRLTAIAAQPDMNVTALILGANRAIPQNYLHVTPNPARLDWQRGVSNYRQLISAAVDEAGGNAFTTEFAGSTAIFRRAIEPALRIERRLEAQVTAGSFVNQVASEGLFARPETLGIIRRHITQEMVESAGADYQLFLRCPTCETFRLESVPFDPLPAVEEFTQRIFTPDREAEAMFQAFPYVTRLFTTISPEEMNLDPTFNFRDGLGDVSNVRSARVVRHCGSRNFTEVFLEDGTNYELGPDGMPIFGLPAAEKIEDIFTGTVIVDNTSRIRQPFRDTVETKTCGCNVTTAEAGGFAVGPLLLALAFVLRRRRPH